MSAPQDLAPQPEPVEAQSDRPMPANRVLSFEDLDTAEAGTDAYNIREVIVHGKLHKESDREISDRIVGTWENAYEVNPGDFEQIFRNEVRRFRAKQEAEQQRTQQIIEETKAKKRERDEQRVQRVAAKRARKHGLTVH